MDILQDVMQRLCVGWTQHQKDLLRLYAVRYLDGEDSDLLVQQIRELVPQEEMLDPGASYVVFSTWLLNRAGKFGQRLKGGRNGSNVFVDKTAIDKV